MYNYRFPWNTKEYVHRVGRTGRAGKTGISFTLMTQDNWKTATDLIKILKRANQSIPEDLATMAECNHQKKDTGKKNQENLKENPRSFSDVYTGKLHPITGKVRMC